MKRMGMVIGVKPERIAEYRSLHAAVWPDVLAMISACNIRKYTIFLREPENLLFAVWDYHGSNFAADAARMAADPVTQKWWAICGPCQEPLASRGPGEWWAPMEELFHQASVVECDIPNLPDWDILTLRLQALGAKYRLWNRTTSLRDRVRISSSAPYPTPLRTKLRTPGTRIVNISRIPTDDGHQKLGSSRHSGGERRIRRLRECRHRSELRSASIAAQNYAW